MPVDFLIGAKHLALQHEHLLAHKCASVSIGESDRNGVLTFFRLSLDFLESAYEKDTDATVRPILQQLLGVFDALHHEGEG